MAWWYRVRTWALICGGISTLLVSIFARTLDRFILSLAGSEDMRCVRSKVYAVCGGGQRSAFDSHPASGASLARSCSRLPLVLYSSSTRPDLVLILGPTLSKFLRVARFLFVPIDHQANQLLPSFSTTYPLAVSLPPPFVSQNVFAN